MGPGGLTSRDPEADVCVSPWLFDIAHIPADSAQVGFLLSAEDDPTWVVALGANGISLLRPPGLSSVFSEPSSSLAMVMPAVYKMVSGWS